MSAITATINITPAQIANLIGIAIEAGDPVTTASRGGWCSGIFWKSKRHTPPAGHWYYEAEHYGPGFFLAVHEYDEDTGKETRHRLDADAVAKGIAIMATKFGHLFAQITDDDMDAPCADIFLQCCLFGDEKYA